MKAMIALEDGRIFEGFAFGAEGEADGEMVFNTSMTGYQEILTDPSYKGQIVTMTYPLIGNYGINFEDIESEHPQVNGFVVREYSRIYSNWRAKKSLEEYLKEHNIIAIEGVDTRALTKHIRTRGAMKAVISTSDLSPESLTAKAKASISLVGMDMVKEVTCKRGYPIEPSASRPFRVAAIDYGIKNNIIKMLSDAGCNVILFPASTTASEILASNPDGVFLSNGPGDPSGVPYAVDTVKSLIFQQRSSIISKLPIFGICLGHQILGLAFGGKTYKLKFGHRGGNQPVKDLSCGKIDITSQNHGFCVDINSLNPDEVEITHINANDQTLEGMRHKNLPIFSVQYHPEASPG
ncbi:MAG: glutamine-hydrolyzing carbamoyl-phosphate synthase small subunit, partial [Candidatus Desantisbacteria bacterium]